ncbi:hypothetical protein C499_15565 [Halogeometricum borinquense DSM 11551]|uniref:Conserved repeat protein n=2 Tax=Halogeometricum borinquense TaxID=60847 RepID=E4NSN4_HALBP|nr:DUF58 domain-containing protein [Halogeometricum borinquense]ADQ68127.1 conserved repeat protein [Halogeometricum borinquense DSM 11551]ELY24829.1 hypothetical protein C499_15565 [Halogeometricum borinquense DSM 11551]RYJ12968.1 DUF58 domain-containing protein [Halogeometricum borinquense]
MNGFDTHRWTGIEGAALIAGAAGVVFQQPALLLVAGVGVAYTAYAWFADAPAPALDITRELSNQTPDTGEDVRVTVTVRNVGATPLTDLRLIDGVPPALEVTDGSARIGTALRPGKAATFSYSVEAVRGEHAWDPLHAVVRSPSAETERSEDISPDETTVLRCTPSLEATADLPLRGLTTQYTGRVATNVAGAGLEFYSTREYRRGDPLNRIDWNRRARTGEMATLEFREERAATVVLLIDARSEAYVATDEGEQNAVERSVDAATRAFSSLLDSGDRVGVAALSPHECWLAPTTGSDHRARARELFAANPALAPTPSDDSYFPVVALRRLRRRLPSDAQVLFFSPLADDFATVAARRLDAHGHLVTVVSPDPTTDDTPGHRLAAIERQNRLAGLRQSGIRAIDWGEEPLATELARAERRWSQ